MWNTKKIIIILNLSEKSKGMRNWLRAKKINLVKGHQKILVIWISRTKLPRWSCTKDATQIRTQSRRPFKDITKKGLMAIIESSTK